MLLRGLLLLSCFTSGFGALLQVSVAGADVGNCNSAACATIKYAISQASTGDTLQLGEGTFIGHGNRNIVIGVQPGVDPIDLQIRSVAGPKSTIINIEKGGRGFRIGEFAGAVLIEGITLTNGLCSALDTQEDKNGAGFHLANSRATVRNVRILNMDCTVDGVEYTKWSGAAFYLKDSHVLVDKAEVVDAVANHGGGVAAWGNDQSRVQNSIFLRGSGLQWGGCMLMEDNVSTFFENVRFSFSKCGYGGAMDDGSTAHPTFKNCTFEYAESLYGGAAYHYGSSYTSFDQCVFQHNVQQSGTVYINALTKPSFKDVVFYNNTATGEAAAIRSYYGGHSGPIRLDRAQFISNKANMIAGAVMIMSNFEFNDCLFESNRAEESGGAFAFQYGIGGHGVKLWNATFKANTALSHGGAIHFLPAQSPTAVERFTLDECSFVKNLAYKNGGAIAVEWGLNLKILRSKFSANEAKLSGGSLHLANILVAQDLDVLINDTTFEKSIASSGGGAISCSEPVYSKTNLRMSQFAIMESRTFHSGGGLSFDCSYLNLRDGRFQRNRAVEGNGGAISFSSTLQCAKGNARLEEVRFHDNFALEGGGILFFDHLNPECKIPMLGGGMLWNASSSDVWSWSNFEAAVSGNQASYGTLQATAPSAVGVKCDSSHGDCSVVSSGLKVQGFPGIEVQFEASLIDDFGQHIISPGLQIEVVLSKLNQTSQNYVLKGIQRHALQDGIAQISELFLIGGADNDTSIVPLLVRIPRGLAIQNVKTALVDVKVDFCPAGFRWNVDVDTGARKCSRCSSGKFSLRNSDNCTVCEPGNYASQSGSSSCFICPSGHGCPLGTTDPVSCNEGFYQASNGSDACKRCPKGTYQQRQGQTACNACPTTQTTQGPGSVSRTDCGCAVGFYVSGQNMQQEQCKECPRGLKCAGFSGEIMLKAGYYSELPLDPSVGAWLCTSEVVCVGQANPSVAVCAKHAIGLNCGLCEVGTHRSSDGTCEDCAGDGQAFVPIFAIVLFGLCGACHYKWNRRAGSNAIVEKKKESVLGAVSIGVMVAFMQQVSIMQRLTFNWPGEFNSIMTTTSLLLFDLDILKINCMVSQSFTQSYLTGLALPIILILYFISWLFLSRLIHMVTQKFPAFTFESILNSIGMILQALYISIVTVTVSLFQCYESGPAGERALTKFPWVKCYDIAWMSMLPFCVFALLVYVLGFFSFLCWMALVAPTKWGNAKFRIASRFLLFKYRSNTWWYGLIILFRSLCLALVPVVSPDDAYVQFFLLLFVILVALVAHLVVQPYSTIVGNRLESFELLILVGILALGSWFIEARDYTGEDENQAFALSIILCVLFFCCTLAVLGSLSYAIGITLQPEKAYAMHMVQLQHIRKEYSDACSLFTSLDGDSQVSVLLELNYADLARMQSVADVLALLIDGSSSRLSKRRLSDPTLKTTLSLSSSAICLDVLENDLPDVVDDSVVKGKEMMWL